MKNKIFALGLLLILISVSACKESFLDSAPYGQQTDVNFYKTVDQCKGGVMQAYNRTVHLGPIYLFIRHGLAEYTGDDLLRTERDDFTVWHNFSPDNVQFLWGWKYCYQGIYIANFTLEHIQSAAIDEEQKNGLIAECKAIRGFMYYLLASRFGSAPLNISVLPVAEYFKLPFSPVEDVYAQAIKDFTEALPYLPKTWDANNKGRFSQAAAKHMLAKIYMELAGYPINKTENWQKAVDVLAEFVPMDKRGDYDLQLLPNYGDVFTPLNNQNKESVFEVNFMFLPQGKDISLEVGAPGNFLPIFTQPNVYDGGGRECYTADFLDEFEKDVDDNIIDRRFTYTTLEPGDVWYITREGDTTIHNSLGRWLIENVKVDESSNALTYDIKNDEDKQFASWTWVGKDNGLYPNYKYMQNASERTGWLNGGGVNGNNLSLKYLRFSDAILCYAEALNEVGRSADAVPYLNEIRARVNTTEAKDPRRVYQKTIVTGVLPMVDAGLGQSELRDAIRHEWRVELAGEDWRYDNIRRWGIAEERLHAMAAKSPIKGANFSNDASKYQKGAWDYFPAPSDEFRTE